LTEAISELDPSEVASAIEEFEPVAVNTVHQCDIDQITEFENRLEGTELNARDALNEQGLMDKLAGGMYCRILHIPKGTFFTGKVHHNPYIDIFVSGDMTVKSFLADGTLEEPVRYTETQFFEGIPGRKRVIYAHEDCVWITVDPTKVENIEDAEDDTLSFQHEGYMKLKEAE